MMCYSKKHFLGSSAAHNSKTHITLVQFGNGTKKFFVTKSETQRCRQNKIFAIDSYMIVIL